MYSAWTKHLKDNEEKIQFEKSIYGSKPILKRIKELMDEDGKAIDSSERTLKDFDQPNWEHKQAFRNGYKACLFQINRLIDLDQQQYPTTENIK